MTILVDPPPAPRQAQGERASGRPEGRSDFGPLVRQVRAEGLLDRRPDWYLGLATAIIVGLVATMCGLLLLGGSWWALLLAPVAALLSAQLSFFGHDAGHHQISGSKGVGRLIGLLAGNLLTGLSFGWWQDKHLRHHSHPNHEGVDPDVGEGVISWSERQYERKSGLGRWFGRRQHWFFFPLLTLEGWHLQLAGLRALRERPRGARRLEAALLVVHHAAYLGFLGWLLSPPQMIIFVLLHQALYGLLLGSAFAPNHKGMPMPSADDRLGHLHKQVLTSRDVRGGPVIDFLLGGLNYQVEHHLFPSMPRPSLRRAQPMIASYCAEIGLPYRVCGVRESYAQCLRHLASVSRGAGSGRRSY